MLKEQRTWQTMRNCSTASTRNINNNNNSDPPLLYPPPQHVLSHFLPHQHLNKSWQQRSYLHEPTDTISTSMCSPSLQPPSPPWQVNNDSDYHLTWGQGDAKAGLQGPVMPQTCIEYVSYFFSFLSFLSLLMIIFHTVTIDITNMALFFPFLYIVLTTTIIITPREQLGVRWWNKL